MNKPNQIIRNSLKEKNVTQWKVAEKLKISEFTLVRKLRKELSQKEREKILNIIQELSN